MTAISRFRMIGPRFAALAALVGFGIGAAGRVEASLITYTESTVASGTLGSTSFTNALLTLTFVGDTDNVTHPSAFMYMNSIGTATVTVAGVGTANFTDQIAVYDDQTYAAGFLDVTNNKHIIDQAGGFHITYDLKTAVGPATGPIYPGTNTAFATDQGTLVITSAASSGTFTATVTAVPEPSSLVLALFGLAAPVVATGLRRRKP